MVAAVVATRARSSGGETTSTRPRARAATAAHSTFSKNTVRRDQPSASTTGSPAARWAPELRRRRDRRRGPDDRLELRERRLELVLVRRPERRQVEAGQSLERLLGRHAGHARQPVHAVVAADRPTTYRRPPRARGRAARRPGAPWPRPAGSRRRAAGRPSRWRRRSAGRRAPRPAEPARGVEVEARGRRLGGGGQRGRQRRPHLPLRRRQHRAEAELRSRRRHADRQRRGLAGGEHDDRSAPDHPSSSDTPPPGPRWAYTGRPAEESASTSR